MRAIGGPANYAADVSDPEHRAAEDLVSARLAALGYAPIDNRASRTSCDFWLTVNGRPVSFDVKHDRHIDRTDNVAFESHHELADGTWRDGWGNSDLEWVGVVGAARNRCRIYRVRPMCFHVADHCDRWQEMGWRRFAVTNDARAFFGVPGPFVTHGYAIPRRQLEAAPGVWVADISLPSGWEGFRNGLGEG